MGAPPVDRRAARAAAELGLLTEHAGRHLGLDRRTLGRLQLAVAAQAAFERSGGGRQVEPLDDLGELVVRPVRADEVATRDDPPLQQAVVAGQENPIVVGRPPGKLRVGRMVVVGRVEAAHPQVGGQPPEVTVDDEAQRRDRQRWRRDADHGLELDRAERREDRHSIPGRDPAGEGHRLAVDDDQPDLRMGHPDRLDDVLHGGRPVERPSDRGLAERGGQEVVQRPVEAELRAPATGDLAFDRSEWHGVIVWRGRPPRQPRMRSTSRSIRSSRSARCPIPGPRGALPWKVPSGPVAVALGQRRSVHGPGRPPGASLSVTPSAE